MTVRNLTVAQYIADSANQPYPTGDVVTIIDSSANLSALTTGQIASFGTNHVDAINSTDDVLSWSVAQWQAVPTGLTFDASDLKVVFDTGAHLATLSTTDLANLNTYGVTLINPQDGLASFTAAQYGALGGISIDQDSDVTLADTGANISGLSAAEIGALAIKGFDVIDASDNAYSLSVAQAQALSGVTIHVTDTVTLADTHTALEALSASDYAAIAAAGLSIVDASDNILALTDAQLSAITNSGMTLAAGDDVTLADTGAAITAHDFNNLAIAGVDFIDATDNAMSVSVNQANELIVGDVVASDSADVITLFDTAFNIANNLTSFADLGEAGVDQIDVSDSAGLGLTAAQLDDIANAGVVFSDASDEIDLLDSAATLDALTAGEFGGYINQGVDFFGTGGAGAYDIDKATADLFLASTATFSSTDTVSLVDTGANIAAYTATQLTALKNHGVDALDASDNVLNLTVAQYGGLSGLALTAGDTVTLVDTGANLAAMSVSTISGLAAAHVDAIDASDTNLTLSAAQFQALGAVALTDADNVTVADAAATLAGLSALNLSDMGEAGVDHIDSLDDTLSLTVAQADVVATGGEIGLTGADVVTLADTGANLAAVAAGTFTTYGANGIDKIDSSTNAVSFTVAQADAIIGASIGLTAGDTVTLADTSAAIDALTSTKIAGYDAATIDVIDSTQNATAYDVDVAGARALEAGAIHLAADDTTFLADTSTNLQGLSVTEISGLAAEGIDTLNASDNVLNLTVAQALALGAVAVDAGDTFTVLDTGANLAALTTGQLAALDAAGVDFLNASDNTLNLSVAQYQALGEIGLTSSDTVTLLDSGAALAGLSAAVLGELGADNVDVIDANDNALSLTIAQVDALNTGETGLTGSDVVTLSDTEANIEALTASHISQFSSQGVDLIHAGDTGVLNMSAAQVGAVGSGAISFKAGDTVTLSDSGANIAALSAAQFAAMVGDNVDTIDANDANLNLTAAQYLAIADTTTHLTASDTVTLVDTGANLAGLSAAQFAALASNNIDRLNASDNVLALNVAQYGALGAVQLTGGDVVSIKDTGVNLATLNFSSLAASKVDAIDATDNVLTLTYGQFSSLGTVSLAAGDDVTLSDASAIIEALTGAQLLALGGKGIDHIDTTDNVLHLNLTQFNNLGAVTLAAGDVVTLADTEAHLENMGAAKVNQLNTAGVDIIDSTDGAWNMTEAVAAALVAGAAKAVGADTVKVVDTGANIALLTAGQIGQLATHNVDALDASDDALTLTTGQFNALGTVALTGSDVVTLSDTGSLLATMNFATLNAKGIDVLDATDDVVNINVAQYRAIGALTFDGSDTVTLRDTGAALQGLSVAEIAALDDDHNISVIDSTTDLLTLSVDQFNALNETGLTGSDVVTVSDTGANLATLDFSVLGGLGVDRIDATDNQLTLSKAQVDLLGSVALTATDVVTMTAGEGAIESLTAGQLASYAALGVDILDSASDFALLDAAQVAAMVNTGLKMKAADNVVLADSSANVIANLGALFDHLGSTGVDTIDLSDDGINLTVEQATGLDGVAFDASDDNVVVLDSAANLEALTAAQIAALGAAGVDTVDATDDIASLTVAQATAGFAAGIDLTQSDDITLADTGANIASMDQAVIQQLAAEGIDHVELTDHHVTFNYGQYTSFIEDFSFTALDVVTAKGTNADDSLLGGDERDVFLGKNGDDVMSGGRGQDILNGGKGADVLTGGIGADTFVFNSLADSTVGAADRITDLTNVDVIDLSSIDADTTQTGDQAFHEVKKFTGHAGEVMVKYNAGSDLTLIKLDVDGDGHADAQIAVEGDHHSFDNFVL